MTEDVKKILAKRVKNSDYFKPTEEIIKSHPLGYVSELDTDITALPKEAVSACKNLDFHPGYDQPREPYNLYKDYSSLLPTGYEILRFIEKNFVDGGGNAKRVVIIAAKSSRNGDPLRIYIDWYYLPLPDYDNANKYEPEYPLPVSAGWESGFYELTERHKAGDTGIQYIIIDETIQGVECQIKVVANGTTQEIFGNKRRNYFKGWYIIYDNDVIGAVTASITPGGTYAGTYFQVKLEDGAVLTDNAKVGLCRFPVNQFNVDNWANITDVRFEDGFPGSVRIWCGYESRPLILTFITKRQYFGGAIVGGVAYPEQPPLDWLTVQGIPGFATNRTFKVRLDEIRYAPWPLNFYDIKFKWSVNTGAGFGTETDMPFIRTSAGGSFDAVQELTLGLSVRLKGNASESGWSTSDFAQFDVNVGAAASWDGFYFDYDDPEVLNKKWYKYKDSSSEILSKADIGKELGISYFIGTVQPVTTTGTKTQKIYSFAVEIDGYQTLFVKHVFLPKYPTYHDYLDGKVYFSPAFNRRITAHLLYFAEEEDFRLVSQDSSDYELPEVSRLIDTKRGYYPISKMGAVISNKNWVVQLINSTEAELELNSATGEKLSVDRLNNPYWYSVTQKAKFAFRVGENVVAVNLANVTANADKDTQAPNSNGNEAICVSQLQAGANTASIMSTKRVRQITKGYPLVAGAWMQENQFMLFSEAESYWYDITDEETLAMRRMGIFDGKGLVNADALAEAREMVASEAGPLTAPMKSLIKGIYFAGKLAIYEMANNRLKPITHEEDENGKMIFDRWLDEYKALESKDLIRAGYRSSTQDVYFSVPELGEIRVWSITQKHWKIYEFPDTVKYFVQEQDGEVFFHTADKIYKTEPVGTALTKDKGTAQIEWSFTQYLNHGNGQMMKVLDGFEFTYDLDGTAEAKVHFKVEAADDRTAGGWTIVFDEDITIRQLSEPNKFYERRGYKVRDRGQYYRITLSSTTDTDTQTFKLLVMKLKAYFMQGNITKQ